jgi:TRAP-type transport system small permease protein
MTLAKIEQAFDALLNVLGAAVAFTIVFFAFSMSLDWLLKTLGYRAIPWLRDVIEYLLYAIVLLGAPWVLRQGSHVRVDLVLSILPPRGARILDQILNIIGIFVCGMLGWLGYQLAVQFYVEQSFVRKTITVDRWTLQALLVISMTLCVIEFIFRLKRPAAPRGQLPEGI